MNPLFEFSYVSSYMMPHSVFSWVRFAVFIFLGVGGGFNCFLSVICLLTIVFSVHPEIAVVLYTFLFSYQLSLNHEIIYTYYNFQPRILLDSMSGFVSIAVKP